MGQQLFFGRSFLKFTSLQSSRGVFHQNSMALEVVYQPSFYETVASHNRKLCSKWVLRV